MDCRTVSSDTICHIQTSECDQEHETHSTTVEEQHRQLHSTRALYVIFKATNDQKSHVPERHTATDGGLNTSAYRLWDEPRHLHKEHRTYFPRVNQTGRGTVSLSRPPVPTIDQIIANCLIQAAYFFLHNNLLCTSIHLVAINMETLLSSKRSEFWTATWRRTQDKNRNLMFQTNSHIRKWLLQLRSMVRRVTSTLC